jgi:hypothetical protein
MVVEVYFILISEKNILTITANNWDTVNCSQTSPAAIKYALIQETASCFICP